MKFSEIFSFFIILKESIKLIPKNGKLMASIALLSSILSSILLLLFIRFYQSLTEYVISLSTGPDSSHDTSPSLLKYLALLGLVEFTFLLAYFVISHITRIATILVSSSSYNGNNISPTDLFSSIKRTWRKPLSTGFRFSHHSSTRVVSFICFLTIFLAFMYPNIYTIYIAIIIGAAFIILMLYSSVVLGLSTVVLVIEESSAEEAIEKARILVKGHQRKGFMLNLFVGLVFSIVFWLVLVLNDEGSSVSVTVSSLCFVNLSSIVNMVLLTAYTVLYFECRKHHGEEISVARNLEYTKLYTTTTVGDDNL